MPPDTPKPSPKTPSAKASQGWYVWGFVLLTVAWTIWLPQPPLLWYSPQTFSQIMALLLAGAGLLCLLTVFLRNRDYAARGWFPHLLILAALLLFPLFLAQFALRWTGRLAPFIMALLLAAGSWYLLKKRTHTNKKTTPSQQAKPDKNT